MDLGNLLGQILQQGMASQSRSRLEHAAGSGGIGDLLGAALGGGSRAGSGLGDLLGSVLGGGQGRGGAAGGLGDLLGGALGGALGGGQRATASSGGLTDLLGGLLGGQTAGDSSRRSGNAGMALLATLAMAALKNWGNAKQAQAAFSAAPDEATRNAFATMTAADTEALVLRAMCSAAKADGSIDDQEVERIIGRLANNGVSEEEKRFLTDELRKPLDLAGLVASVPNEAVAAEIYAASLLAIDVDTEAEIAYLRQLAQGLKLDAGAVWRLHEMMGATRA
jgi:uncharacterized membrane protein YebE (DUF533 family)